MKRPNDDLAALADDGFHEIQLSGKQLVFLFMATTIVSVVIFLSGVLVGRGVRPETGAAAASLDAPITEADPALDAPAAPGASEAAPAPAELSYYDRLGSASPGVDTLKETATPPPAAPVAEAPPAQAPPAESAPPVPEPTARSPLETGSGFTIQVAVLTDRAKAEALVTRLENKGFPAYIATPGAAGSNLGFRVRVGRYQDRSDADRVVRRLEKEEQFKPWITR